MRLRLSDYYCNEKKTTAASQAIEVYTLLSSIRVLNILQPNSAMNKLISQGPDTHSHTTHLAGYFERTVQNYQQNEITILYLDLHNIRILLDCFSLIIISAATLLFRCVISHK